MILLNPVDRCHVWIIVLIYAEYLLFKLLNCILFNEFTFRVALPENSIQLKDITFAFFRDIFFDLFHELLYLSFHTGLACWIIDEWDIDPLFIAELRNLQFPLLSNCRRDTTIIFWWNYWWNGGLARPRAKNNILLRFFMTSHSFLFSSFRSILRKVFEKRCHHHFNLCDIQHIIDTNKVIIFFTSVFLVDDLEIILVIHPIDKIGLGFLLKFLPQSSYFKLFFNFILFLFLVIDFLLFWLALSYPLLDWWSFRDHYVFSHESLDILHDFVSLFKCFFLLLFIVLLLNCLFSLLL